MSFGKNIVLDEDDSNGFGDDFFLLPSQRKKLNQQNGSGSKKKTKKKPTKQQQKPVDILDDDDDFMFNDAFQIDSDKVSPNNTDKSSFPKEESKKDSPNKKTINLETNSRSVIEQIESSLKDYISNAINSVRQSFIDELKVMIDDSRNDQSIIDSFLFSLPAEIEEIALKEIKAAKEEYVDKTNSITETISSFFNIFDSILPISTTKHPTTSIEKLADDVYLSRTSLDDKFVAPIRDLQNLNKFLASAKSQDMLNHETKRIQSPVNILLIEAEADSKRIEIEEQALNYKKKMFEQRRNEWKEAQIDPNRNKMTDPELLLNKFSELSRKIPQSKYGGAVYNLKTLTEKIQFSISETKHLRKQFEVESTFLVSKMNSIRSKKRLISKSKSDYAHTNEYVNDVKKQLDFFKKEREFHERNFKNVS